MGLIGKWVATAAVKSVIKTVGDVTANTAGSIIEAVGTQKEKIEREKNKAALMSNNQKVTKNEYVDSRSEEEKCRDFWENYDWETRIDNIKKRNAAKKEYENYTTRQNYYSENRENTKNEQTNQRIHMECKNCHGMMDIDSNREIMTCPFCGSQDIIIKSDAVKVQEIKAQAYKEVELEKSENFKLVEEHKHDTYKEVELGLKQLEIEKQRMEYEQKKEEEKRNFNQVILIWGILIGVMLFIMLISAFMTAIGG